MSVDESKSIPTAIFYDANQSLIDGFARTSAAVPDTVALAGGNSRYTYSQMTDASDRIARHLLAIGVKPGDNIVLISDRTANAVLAMTGIMRAGAAYVPLDPAYDSKQLTYIIKDSRPKVILWDTPYGHLSRSLCPKKVDRLSVQRALDTHVDGTDAFPNLHGDDPCYVMYTSGSTGKPKGVVLPHRAILRLGYDQPTGQVLRGDVALANSTIACDASMWEIWGPLLNGATVALVTQPKPALDEVARVIRDEKVTVTYFYTGLAHLMIEHHLDDLAGLRLFGAGGDVMSTSHIRKLTEAYPHIDVINCYGPTENSVLTTMHKVTPEDLVTGPIPIGIPTGHCDCFVIDEDRQVVPDGALGQLVAAGPGVALGYLNQPDKTAEAFIPDPRPGHEGLVYLTGDLAQRRDSGIYDFFGRADRQVKLGGRRIELDEVEHHLRELPMVTDAAVVLATDKGGRKRIAAFIKPARDIDGDDTGFIREVLSALGEKLHDGMLPRINRVVDDFALTANNKVDRKALLDLLSKETASDTTDAPEQATNTSETRSAHQISKLIVARWKQALGDIDPSHDTTFFDAGGSSLELVDVHAGLIKDLGVSFDIMVMFEAPKLGQLASKLADIVAQAPPKARQTKKPAKTAAAPSHDNLPDTAIAIVGMAARLPESDNLDHFWQHLCNGENLIRPFAAEDAQDSYSAAERASAAYVPARPELADAGMFDAKFFGMYPREAALMDPQARVFLEMAHEALERSGHAAQRDNVSVGVFAGCSMNSYVMQNMLGDRAETEAFTSNYQTGKFAEITGNMPDCLATRVAFKLDLRGPAMTVQTACSTSLTAIAQAILNLRTGQADIALAGGVSITFPQKRGYMAQDGGLASDDGTCRPFDEAASGTVFSHGGGVVVLRRLKDALADGDHIHAVIRGVGINNDGADKIAFTAPTVNGQANAIRRAHADADVSVDTISYVECHGTATPMGDPIEVSGLRQAFGPGLPEASCALGSVKGNLGHMDAGAGVVGVIKTVLMMTHRTLPPLANFKKLNSRINLAGSPFRIQAQGAPWTAPYPLRAGVSSFGVGGTNVHLVLEEAPLPVDIAPPEGVQTLVLSARSREALAEMKDALADAIEAPDAPALADIAFSLQDGRAAYDLRLAVSGDDRKAVASSLRTASLPRGAALQGDPRVSFMFPGQGSQYPGMGSGLYEAEPEFARWIDQGAEILRPILGLDVKTMLCFGDPSDRDLAAALRETRLTQPALYLTQYACARLWMARGVQPAAMIGHSVGEFTAAALAGVFSFETGLNIISQRGQLMQDQPGGAMLSVRATLDELADHLEAGLDIAAHNAPRLNVVAGETAAVDRLEQRLKAADIACSRLHTSHAFHSAMMDPVSDRLAKALKDIPLAAPRIPYVSCVTGTWITDGECTDPAYWARQARAQVNFADAITVLAADEPAILLEVGAGNTLSSFCGQTLPRDAAVAIVQSLPDHTRPESDTIAMANGFGRIWAAGGSVDWAKLGPRGHRRVELPTYAFQRKLHWVDLASTENAPAAAPVSPQTTAPQKEAPIMTAPSIQHPFDRKPRLVTEVLALLSDVSGEELTPDDAEATFLDLGFDSLFLGQVAQKLGAEYGLEVTFRELLAKYPTVAAVAGLLDETLPADVVEAPATVVEQAAIAPAPVVATTPPAVAPVGAVSDTAATSVMQAQIAAMQGLFSQQLATLSGAPAVVQQAPAQPVAPQPPAAPQAEVIPLPKPEPAATVATKASTTFSIGRATNAGGGDLTAEQSAFVRDLAARYSAKSPKTKEYVETYRPTMADPRTAAGFRAEWKELVFPVVCDRSKGSRIWDIDGNEYIDLVSGFGQTAFGHTPDFVVEAITRQMERGFAIGPQSDMAGPIAERFARFVGHERAAFCNTGSEAVMAAMRVARTVTGRDRIVVFGNDYHGQFDEVLVKGKKSLNDPTALPLAPGIPRSSLSSMVVLPYDDQASLDWLTANITTIAAVIVEPVQSRHPDLRPREFVRSVRDITRDGGAAMVMDEVVTGFRVGPRGMQGVWDIAPDMATYGKVVGGGMPIGMLAGSKRFMDALDGGQWQFGDASVPEASPTFFAGTFVRHPLVLAAMEATMDHIDAHGPDLWERTADLTTETARRLNDILAARGLGRVVESYSSWLVPQVTDLDPNAVLLYPLMRLAGVHVQVGYAFIFTTAHTQHDADTVVSAFENAVDTLRAVGILGNGTSVPVALPPVAAGAAPTKGIPLTEAQREIWMTAQLGRTASCCFNESGSLELSGPLDLDALQTALDQVIARHDGLRMVFARSGETFDILDPYTLPLKLHDLSDADDAAVETLLAEDAATEIDIVTGPPLRAFVVRRTADKHLLVLNAHHIVCDGWSFNVIAQDLAAFYTQAVNGTPANLPDAPSFAKFATEKTSATSAPETLAFWRDRFKDVPDLPELPTDRARPEIKSFAGATCTALISGEVMRAARKAGAAQGCTLFSTLFAALHITVARLTGSDDIVLGVPTGGQALLENQAMVGHCVNFLPIRVAQEPDMQTSAFLAQVGTTVMDAFDNQDYTYGTLVRDLDIPRSLNRLPLTEIQFNLERLSEGLEMGPLTVTMTPNAKRAVNFDLFFNVVERKDGLRVDVDYNTDVFDADTVMRWVGHLETVLGELAADTARPLAQLPITSRDEQVWLAETLNATQVPVTAVQTVHARVSQACTQHADRVAVEDSEGQHSYASIAAHSDAIAAALQAQGVKKGERVAVALPRSARCIAALLGVMKAGAAYVPIDQSQPAERLRMILKTADVSAILHDGTETPDCAKDLDLPTLSLETMPTAGTPEPVETDGDTAAYVMFTSGSTGTPKGVEIGHAAVVNLLESMARDTNFDPESSLLAVTTIMFDISVLELFMPLICGGRTVIASHDDVLDGFRLVTRIKQGDISHMQATPTLWSMLLEAGFEPVEGLTLLAGGEPLAQDLADKLTAGGATLWNVYGPTETTIWSAAVRLAAGDPVTIGGPIANTEMHVLGRNDMLLPVGAVGELNIGGIGLAHGYFQQPDLTQAAFRDVTLLGQPRRLYKTGDMARRLADGRIEVLGRADAQVKLRGFRIELGEIESNLRALPEVSAAAVALRPSPRGGDQLVGYIVSKTGTELQAETLARALADKVPGYMVPSAWAFLSKLPSTANGKLDRRALPDPDTIADVTALHTAPTTETERKIAQVWEHVLGLKTVSTSQTLFALGADSLTVFRIAARLIDANVNIEARHLLEYPSIARLAEFVDQRGARGGTEGPKKPSLRAYRRTAANSA
ncbi:amino acid adenylation domain-containing protein [Pseudosulfitobacter pseudonitzschiae]|uniref:Amino acid adenylation domain-containing protein n=1 Tax=Pseudosulfitobacter pseudonitzschiae TaxID=1402135 RepID=A0A073J1L6_9RHOB|nr:hybrid non-ribosomal peptide synthetase/type I polyketide synthase [Pseudosulfitobacter pseudonitzschiae]KEJ95561.1 hypothetical protein SUH3_21490 [Pseudosulfitobacter pseudonitzschiae]QKS10151.1 hybrid non-ribosomal peptide synthetase/type I polyketide synthase [Pseudosulfitobacter pseudonitzschiae]SHE83407.1 amino acid adenylation domain-containing protein [Pseudosulfitobacter pseudonitzschiae]